MNLNLPSSSAMSETAKIAAPDDPHGHGGLQGAGARHAAIGPVDIVVGIAARDQIRLRGVFEADGGLNQIKLTGIGCPELIVRLEQMREQLHTSASRGSLQLHEFELPTGADHTAILFRELFLRARGEWHPPYVEAELCHCRSVPTARVDQAIVCGSHTIQQIARETSAGTSCGTCRTDSEALIRHRLAAF